jgi:hypothetical protein
MPPKKTDPRKKLGALLNKQKDTIERSQKYNRLATAASNQARSMQAEITEAAEALLKENIDLLSQYRWTLNLQSRFSRHRHVPDGKAFYTLHTPIKNSKDPILELFFGNSNVAPGDDNVVALETGITFSRQYNQYRSKTDRWLICFVGSCFNPDHKDNQAGEPVHRFVNKHNLKVGLPSEVNEERKAAEETLKKIAQIKAIIAKDKKK